MSIKRVESCSGQQFDTLPTSLPAIGADDCRSDIAIECDFDSTASVAVPEGSFGLVCLVQRWEESLLAVADKDFRTLVTFDLRRRRSIFPIC